MTFLTIKMPVTTLDQATKKRVPVGEVDIYVPTLADAGVTSAVQSVGEDKKPLFSDEGIPVYEKDEHNFLMDALYSAVKAQARNRFKQGTVEYKGNLKVSTNWAELTAENVGANSGEALAKFRELKALFLGYVTGLGKSPQARDRITTLFNERKALIAQDQSNKDKMQAYVEAFIETLSAEQTEKYLNSLQSVLDACAPVEEAADF